MIPTNSEKAKKYGCKTTSSNCVVWQGPDLDCISLCKGDTISEVNAKIASELCVIMDQFNLSNYDLSCLKDNPTSIDNVKDIIQVLIDKVCETSTITSDNTTITSREAKSCPENCIVNISSCFTFTNEVGDLITEMPLLDYVNAIGNKVCSIVSDLTIINDQIDTINNTLNSTNGKVSSLENNKVSKSSLNYQLNAKTNNKSKSSSRSASTTSSRYPSTTSSQSRHSSASTSGPTSRSSSEPLFITDALREVENSTISNKESIGDIESVFNAISEEGNIPEEKRLLKDGLVKSIFGYILKPKNIAESINNIWLNIKELREAVSYILLNWDRQTCNSLNLLFRTDLINNKLVIYTNGSTGFTSEWKEIGGDTEVLIEDSLGNMTSSRFPLILNMSDPTGYNIDLTYTQIDTTTNLKVTLKTKFFNSKSNTTCERDYVKEIVMSTECPSVTLNPSYDSVNYLFTGLLNYTYIVNIYYAGGSTVVTSQILNLTNENVNSTISGLINDTNYEFELIMKNSIGEEKKCNKLEFKTLLNQCLPPNTVTSNLTT